MSLLDPTSRAALAHDPQKAGEAMESLLMQRMLSSCHLMGKSHAPGAGMRDQMFVETLADAVTKGGGLGLAKQLAGTATSAASENDPATKDILTPNHSSSGMDLETQLLQHKSTLIDSTKLADNILGEP
jgi:hypothetical protein